MFANEAGRYLIFPPSLAHAGLFLLSLIHSIIPFQQPGPLSHPPLFPTLSFLTTAVKLQKRGGGGGPQGSLPLVCAFPPYLPPPPLPRTPGPSPPPLFSPPFPPCPRPLNWRGGGGGGGPEGVFQLGLGITACHPSHLQTTWPNQPSQDEHLYKCGGTCGRQQNTHILFNLPDMHSEQSTDRQTSCSLN